MGNCWIGIKPGSVIGLSKFTRVADWVFSRPHIQEEAVMILTDEIENFAAPGAGDHRESPALLHEVARRERARAA